MTASITASTSNCQRSARSTTLGGYPRRAATPVSATPVTSSMAAAAVAPPVPSPETTPPDRPHSAAAPNMAATAGAVRASAVRAGVVVVPIRGSSHPRMTGGCPQLGGAQPVR